MENREIELINDLLDLTGYKFVILSYFKRDLIKVSDNYFNFIYRLDDNSFFMDAKSNTFIVFDDEYDLFERLDVYKKTYKSIKELLKTYIKD